jgi:hypothetical protein
MARDESTSLTFSHTNFQEIQAFRDASQPLPEQSKPQLVKGRQMHGCGLDRYTMHAERCFVHTNEAMWCSQ